MKFGNKAVIGSLAMLLLAVGSLAVGSVAWFSSTTLRNVEVTSFEVQGGLSVQARYYNGNYDASSSSYSGYKDPRYVLNESDKAGCSSYSTGFTDIAGNAWVADGPLDIQDINPGINFTFALEVSSERKGTNQVSFAINSFASPESSTNKISGSSPEAGIRLASAVDIYTTSFSKGTDAQNTALVDAFLKNTTPSDHFDYDANGEAVYTLSTPDVAYQGTSVILYTIGFSDTSDTYYRFVSSSSNKYYFEKSTAGNSTAYQGLSFTITSFGVLFS